MHSWDASKIFQVLPFYDADVENPEARKLNNVELLKELLFYDELNIAKNKLCSKLQN